MTPVGQADFNLLADKLRELAFQVETWAARPEHSPVYRCAACGQVKVVALVIDGFCLCSDDVYPGAD
jgi:hypothetical protein